MCHHYILSTARPQALGSLRHFISPNQHFKDLKSCCHWAACGARLPTAPRKGVEKLPYSTYIPVQPIQILFSLQGTTASSAAWRNWDKCKLLGGRQCLWAPQRGTLARLSRTCCCGTTGSDSSAAELAAWKLRAGTAHTNTAHWRPSPWNKAAAEGSSRH